MIYKSDLLLHNPQISVCIPTYNQEIYITETLESIVTQKASIPFEIIIADDCSSDRTMEICLEYQNKYPDKIFFIANEQNQGLIKNLFDVLFVNARGKYIALCAGDDVWINENKLQKQYEILEKNSNVSVVHTGYNKFYEISKKLIPTVGEWKSPLQYMSGKDSVKHVILENFNFFPLGSSTMFRISTINKYKSEYSFLIYNQNTPGEAMILYSFYILDGLFYCLPEIMVNYRVRENSMCHIQDLNKDLLFKVKFRIYQKTLFAKTFSSDKKIVKRINRTFLIFFSESLKNGNIDYFNQLYENYKKENVVNIPAYVRFIIAFFSLNRFNMFIYKIFFELFLKLRNTLIIKN